LSVSLKKTHREPGFGHRLTEPESVFSSTKILVSKALTGTGGADLALHLAQIIANHPELTRIIEAWPNLPAHIKTVSKTPTESFRTAEKQKETQEYG
jgi:hypothetical protein